MKVVLLNKNPAVSRLIKLSLSKIGYSLEEIENPTQVEPWSSDLFIIDHEMVDENVDYTPFGKQILFLVPRNFNKKFGKNNLEKPFLPTDFVDLVQNLTSDKVAQAPEQNEQKTPEFSSDSFGDVGADFTKIDGALEDIGDLDDMLKDAENDELAKASEPLASLDESLPESLEESPAPSDEMPDLDAAFDDIEDEPTLQELPDEPAEPEIPAELAEPEMPKELAEPEIPAEPEISADLEDDGIPADLAAALDEMPEELAEPEIPADLAEPEMPAEPEIPADLPEDLEEEPELVEPETTLQEVLGSAIDDSAQAQRDEELAELSAVVDEIDNLNKEPEPELDFDNWEDTPDESAEEAGIPNEEEVGIPSELAEIPSELAEVPSADEDVKEPEPELDFDNWEDEPSESGEESEEESAEENGENSLEKLKKEIEEAGKKTQALREQASQEELAAIDEIAKNSAPKTEISLDDEPGENFGDIEEGMLENVPESIKDIDETKAAKELEQQLKEDGGLKAVDESELLEDNLEEIDESAGIPNEEVGIPNDEAGIPNDEAQLEEAPSEQNSKTSEQGAEPSLDDDIMALDEGDLASALGIEGFEKKDDEFVEKELDESDLDAAADVFEKSANEAKAELDEKALNEAKSEISSKITETLGATLANSSLKEALKGMKININISFEN